MKPASTINEMYFPLYELFIRIARKIDQTTLGKLIEPNQEYIDLHWPWQGYIRIGSPKVYFLGGEVHVAQALWTLWQGHKGVAKRACHRVCNMTGCVNPHHYKYAGLAQPVLPEFGFIDHHQAAMARINPAVELPVELPPSVAAYDPTKGILPCRQCGGNTKYYKGKGGGYDGLGIYDYCPSCDLYQPELGQRESLHSVDLAK
jgi:hypothetical protein